MYFKLKDKTKTFSDKKQIYLSLAFVKDNKRYSSGRKKMPLAESLKSEKEIKSNKKENVSKTIPTI